MKKTILFLSLILLATCLLTACDYINPHTHNFDEWETTKAPTCTEEGERIRFCSCGEKDSVTEVIPATGHSFDGATCIVCGENNPTYVNECLEYTLSDDGSSYIVSGIGTYKETNIIIPSVYNDLPVTKIGMHAFHGCNSFTSVVIPDSITSIGFSAFYGCSSLTSVIIPNSVVDMGTWAFYNCSSLTAVIILDGVTSIGNNTFNGCRSLTSIVIPDSVTSIGESAFKECSSLTSIVIPEGVTDIGKEAFYGCNSLASVVIPEGVTVIRDLTFTYCHSLKSVVIYEGVTSIGESAFRECSSLTSIDIPDSVTIIDSRAFSDCYSLVSVVIGNGVNYIFHNSFSNCNKLVEVVNKSSLDINVGSSDYGNVAYNAMEVHDGKSKIIIVDDYIFYSHEDVNYLLDYVGNNADLILPENYNGEKYEIYKNAFYNCDSLTSVVISSSVTGIGEKTFEDCDSLVSVVIGESVTNIGNYAFFECFNLVEIINKSSLDITAGSSDYGYVAYYAIEVNNEASKIVIVNDYVFYTYNDVNYLTGYVGKDTNLTLPENYNGEKYAIYKQAFYRCDSLKSVVIPDSVTSIGDKAFWDCDLLTSMVIPDSVTSIGNYAFIGCNSLKSVVIGNGVTSIGLYAFSGCDTLKSVVITRSVTRIGSYAFEDCYLLTDVYYTGSESEWNSISINSGNSELYRVTIHFSYTPEN